MKVMCIDNSCKLGAQNGDLLQYGSIYTVVDERICSFGLYVGHLVYDLAEVSPERYQFLASRFIPISNIDETEMERNYNELLTTK